MNLAILFFTLLQAGAPQQWTKESDVMFKPMASTSLQFVTSINTPIMVIHFSGDKVLEINGADGKKLTLAADGAVSGDLPHDQAAEAFWKAIAMIRPKECVPPGETK